MFSDAHCHFRHLVYDDVEPTVKRIEKLGVELVLMAGIDLFSSEQEILTARRFSRLNILKACIGIHAWNADICNEEALRKLKELALDSNVVAMSEIGLDYFSTRGRETPLDRQIQRNSLHSLLRTAKEVNLPVIIHDGAPNQEILDILQGEGNAKVGAAIHGFNKDLAYARRCVELGIYISIGLGSFAPPELMAKISMQPMPLRSISDAERAERERRNETLREVIRQIDLKWLLTETDRGRYPEGVLIVAEKIAEIKGLTKEEVGRATTQNLKKLVHL